MHSQWTLQSKDLTLPLRVSFFFFLGGGCFGGLGVDTFFFFFFLVRTILVNSGVKRPVWSGDFATADARRD